MPNAYPRPPADAYDAAVAQYDLDTPGAGGTCTARKFVAASGARTRIPRYTWSSFPGTMPDPRQMSCAGCLYVRLRSRTCALSSELRVWRRQRPKTESPLRIEESTEGPTDVVIDILEGFALSIKE